MANYLGLAIADLDKQIAALQAKRALLVKAGGTGRTMSEAGKQKIREAQRKRWAKTRKAAKATTGKAAASK